MSAPRPIYWDYLRLDELLSLQGGLEGDESRLMPDELHFIVVHQCFELWFKLVLRELRLARDHLAAPRVPEEKIPYVVHHLRRVNEIVALMVEQFRVMETLTPQDFLDFRDKLTYASGFQSFQMRELEILLGLPDTERLAYGETDALAHIRQAASISPTGRKVVERLERAAGEMTLRAALTEWLGRTPIQGSSPDSPDDDRVVARFLDEYMAQVARHHEAQAMTMGATLGRDAGSSTATTAATAAATAIGARFAESTAAARRFLGAEDVPPEERPRMRRARAGLLFIESYRELPLLAWPRLLIDTIVELEEQMVLWRTRHARMVERTIGRRIGTGGSSGADYLDRTTTYRVFRELWTVRTLLLPRAYLPALENPEQYGFAR